MKKTLKVKAGPHGPVLMAGKKRSLDEGGADTTVIGDEPVEVENTLYYRKRIEAGELIEVK